MKYEYEKNKIISYSECDRDAKLGLFNIFKLVEDMTTEYFGTIKSDNITLRKENGAAWVYAKISVHINKFPKWEDKIHCKTYTTDHTKIKTEVETIIQSEDGNVILTTMHESCPIDLVERRIRKIDTISYPKDMEDCEAYVKNPFSKLTENFESDDFSYNQIVQASDIDYSNHTNNAMYVKYLLNSFNNDYWNDKKITNFEIHYLKESREGDNLKIYKKSIADNIIEFLIKRDETEIIRAKLEYK